MGGQESKLIVDEPDYYTIKRNAPIKKPLSPARKIVTPSENGNNMLKPAVAAVRTCKFKAAVEKVRHMREVLKQGEMQMPSYYHGWIRKAEVEQLLKQGPRGMFLVKNSTEFAGDLTLCVNNINRITYFRITRQKSMITVDHIKYFDHLDELIEEYKSEDTLGVLLKLPCIQRSDCNRVKTDLPNFEVPVQSFIGCKSRFSLRHKNSRKRKETKVEDMLIFNQES